MTLTGEQIKVASAKKLTSERIRALIHSGELRPGDRISIDDLARGFGLSRTPVRDALWQLNSEGLVEIVPRSGVFVRTISTREVIEVYEAKGVLEPLMARWATQRGTQSERDEFHASIAELQDAAAGDDVTRYVELVEGRRLALMEMADSQVLASLFSVIDGRVRLLRHRNLSQPGRLMVSMNQHALIAEAVRDGDADGAFYAMRFHMKDAKKRVRSLVCADVDESDSSPLGAELLETAATLSALDDLS